jgi:hypothetical protein
MPVPGGGTTMTGGVSPTPDPMKVNPATGRLWTTEESKAFYEQHGGNWGGADWLLAAGTGGLYNPLSKQVGTSVIEGTTDIDVPNPADIGSPEIGNALGGAGDYIKDLLGIDIEGAPLRPENFQLGQEGFNEGRDQAAFTYLEALDKSNRAYTPGEIRDPTLGDVERISAAGPAAVERYSAGGPASVERFDPAVIEATGIDPAETAVFGGVGRAAFNAGDSAAVRGDQLSDIQMLRDTAQGRGPSAADNEYALALDQITNEQMALVNQASGDEKAALRNEAMLEGSRRALAAAHERAALKSREMLGGQQALQSATQAVRSTDIELATTIANLDQEANNLEAQLRTAVAQGNRDAINAINTRKAELAAERARAQAGLTQDARAAGANAANAAQLDYMRRLDEANSQGAAAGNTANLDFTKRTDAASLRNADAADKRDVDRADLGLKRDVAADDAGRNAFGATTDAQLGALNTANNATGQGTQSTQGMVGANKDTYELALKDKEERDRLEAAERQSKRVLVGGLAQAASDAIPDSLL